MKPIGLGLVLTALVTAILCLVWGGTALISGASLGLLATVLQFTATGLLPKDGLASFERFSRRWVYGMGLRMLGVALIAVAVTLDRRVFPPLPAAFGFLGVMIPLLFWELRPVR